MQLNDDLQQAISTCIDQDEVSTFQQLVKQHRFGYVDKLKMSPIIIRASFGKSDKVLQFIIDDGFDVEQSDWIGEQAIRQASDCNSVDTMKILISNVKDVSSYLNSTSEPIFEWAVRLTKKESLAFLLDSGYDQNRRQHHDSLPPIWWASRSGNLDILKMLFESRIPPLIKSKKEKAILAPAACIGSLEILRYLIEERKYRCTTLSQYANQQFHRPPLNEAIHGQYLDCVEYLLEKGAPIKYPHLKYSFAQPLDIKTSDAVKKYLKEKNHNVNDCVPYINQSFDGGVVRR